MPPMCSYLFGGAPLPPEKTHRYQQETAFHVLSPTKAWQRLTSNQRMSELSKGTLVFLAYWVSGDMLYAPTINLLKDP
ncbi:unnamed protein product [Gulo gulo]|uniref:Uncharacterized protein n=1 Tax=Gulo gulo TaxID=48420 RepID=A0A9X9LV83_GULGU|nr:unnamed protein product [Gulo gulo]